MARKKRRRKYSKGASSEVGREMHRAKRGQAKSGKGRHGKVKSRKQAIAIGLSKARKQGNEGAGQERRRPQEVTGSQEAVTLASTRPTSRSRRGCWPATAGGCP